MTQLVNPPLLPSLRLERRGAWLDSCPSGVGERRGESRGESRLCKEDKEERPLRVVRAELRRRRDLGCSGLSGMTTGLSLVPSLCLNGAVSWVFWVRSCCVGVAPLTLDAG
jgi:hypothetical protein